MRSDRRNPEGLDGRPGLPGPARYPEQALPLLPVPPRLPTAGREGGQPQPPGQNDSALYCGSISRGHIHDSATLLPIQARRSRRKARRPVRHSLELQALAIRTGKTYVEHLPELPRGDVELFVDVEGVPDRNSFYLIGLLGAQGRAGPVPPILGR